MYTVEQWLPFVRAIAGRLAQRARNEFDDMVQDGVIGLMQAIRSYDPSRGASFQTHAAHRIVGAILDGCRAWDFLPKSARSRVNRGEIPEPERVPMHEAMRTYRGEQGDGLDDYVRGLERKDRLAIHLYFEVGLTMNEIGQAIGVSESRVSQRIAVALRRIKGRIVDAVA